MEKQKTFTSEGNGIPQTWNPIFGMGVQCSDPNPNSDQLPNCFFNPNCENSIDQRDLFESALSSIVSSPVNSFAGISIPSAGGGADSIVLRELIGRLGSICNSSEISPQSRINSANNSCYDTPLNSPTKLNLSTPDHRIQGNYPIPGIHQLPPAPFPTDPGFVERAARFSTLGVKNESFNTAGSQFKRIPEENKKLRTELGDSMEEPSVSETETETGTGIGMKGQGKGRKRKGISKGKGKEAQSSTAKDDKVVAEVEKDAKRSKSNEEKKGNEKSTEPPKDYIHVRARRGQATDSHSLAERVRREKISERMKFLQDLVPGCSKVTGKAVMLDEIINYVQSLQRQVEFLSMKLATVNPRMDVNMEALLSKDVFRPLVCLPNNVNSFDASVQPFPYGFQSQINGMVNDGPEKHFSMNPLMAAMHQNSIMKPLHIDGFGEVSTLWENDLQSVVKMAIGQDQPQGFHGQMKVEL